MSSPQRAPRCTRARAPRYARPLRSARCARLSVGAASMRHLAAAHRARSPSREPQIGECAQLACRGRRRVQTAPSGGSKATGRRASPTRPRPGEPVHRARPRTAAARDPRPSATLSAALRPPTFKRRHVPANRQAGHMWRNAAKPLRTCRSAAERAIVRAISRSSRFVKIGERWNTTRSGAAAALALAKCAPRRQGGPPLLTCACAGARAGPRLRVQSLR